VLIGQFAAEGGRGLSNWIVSPSEEATLLAEFPPTAPAELGRSRVSEVMYLGPGLHVPVERYKIYYISARAHRRQGQKHVQCSTAMNSLLAAKFASTKDGDSV
jgi:hypothetical protein